MSPTSRTVESVLSIDAGLVKASERPPSYLNVVTAYGGRRALVTCYRRGEAVSAMVAVTWTSCNYGGQRPWWICPDCGRRCKLLYVVGGRLTCRLCGRLTYTTAQAPKWIRKCRKANRLAVRAGWILGTPWPPPRPSGRHWRTWVAELRALADATRTSSEASAFLREQLAREIEETNQVLALLRTEGRQPKPHSERRSPSYQPPVRRDVGQTAPRPLACARGCSLGAQRGSSLFAARSIDNTESDPPRPVRAQSNKGSGT